jgi:PTH1 family peptidyl-tRNA hydrolase
VKLVVGLGNPGRRYAATRHNVGFRIVERFAERHGIELDSARFQGRFGRGRVRCDGAVLDVGVLEPETFMNLSGDCVAEALRRLPVADPASDLLVVVDDVDLPLARLRIRPRGGGGGHRGLTHVIERLGSGDFPRLRFGVGRPPPEMDTADYVLQRFAPDEESTVEASLATAAQAVDALLCEGVGPAMNRFNREPGAEPVAAPERGGTQR